MRWLRFLSWTLVVVLVLGVGVLVAAWVTAVRSRSVGDLYAERAAPDITAAACLKNKGVCDLAVDAPIGALAEYRRCGEVVAGTRIKQGEPLGCSEKGITDLVLSDWTAPGQTAYRQLRRGCRTHDMCYRHGKATYALTQAQCDQEFLAESLRECWLIYGNENSKENPYLKDRDLLRWSCQARASAAYLGVSVMGKKYFQQTLGSTCDYEGGPHAARDHIVVGRFLGGERDYVMSLALAPEQNALGIRLLSFGLDGQSQEVAALDGISPQSVPVADRDWACQRRRTPDGGFAADCPERLEQTTFKRASDWLRFAPIVVDADGDGSEELVIPSLLPDFGLVFTHIRVKQDGAAVSFEPPRAYLGVARVAKDGPANGGCETGLEFADCAGAPVGIARTAAAQSLSNEPATQNAGFQFSVIASPEAGCLPTGKPSKQDVLLLSAFSDFPTQPSPEVQAKNGWDAGYVLRRFMFDAQTQRWEMRRDRFDNDKHRMAGCSIRASRDQFQTHARLQYPSLAVRMPGPKDPPAPGAPPAPVCAPDERLGLISRDKCPTTTPVSKAGNLSDIDLMLYKLDPAYKLASDAEKRERYKKDNDFDDLQMARAQWMPILWTETADPALTSRAARDNGIAMVAAYIGGTQEIGIGGADAKREGHHPVISVLRTEQLRTLKIEWQDRYADTMGHVPDLYGVFKSSSFAVSTSERVSNLWDPHRYGSAEIYFQLPSVLAPFTSVGTKGVSVVFFTNSALWTGSTDRAPQHKSDRLPIADGWVRLLIVPVSGAAQPAMIDCPADAIAQGSAVPATQARGYANFLRREPVMAGKFYDSDEGGSLAVAWRDTTGAIRLTALRSESKTWKFGSKTCAPPAGMKDKELYRDKLN
jgi:hypothetical protein